jgi:hypothetical protein
MLSLSENYYMYILTTLTSIRFKSKTDYQPINNLAKDENGDLLANSRNMLNRWD